MNRREFTKTILGLTVAAVIPKVLAASPLKQEKCVVGVWGDYVSHEIHRVGRWRVSEDYRWGEVNGKTRFLGGHSVWDFGLEGWATNKFYPTIPNFDNLIIQYEKGYEIYFIEGHDPLFNKIISRMSPECLFSYYYKTTDFTEENRKLDALGLKRKYPAVKQYFSFPQGTRRKEFYFGQTVKYDKFVGLTTVQKQLVGLA